MSSDIPKPPYPDINRGSAATAIVWAESAFALIVVVMRLWSRILIRKLGADDWIMLFTLCLLIIWSGFVTHYAVLGGFRHLNYLEYNSSDTISIIYVNYIIQFIVTFAYAPAKTSVGILVLRITAPKPLAKNGGWRRWLIIGSLALVWTATIPNCVMIYLQCRPVKALWEPSIARKDCWNPDVLPRYAFFSSGVNIWTDAILAFIPASVIWTLNMNIKKRLALCVLLGLGILAAICAIVKTTYLSSLGEHSDITWETYNFLIWAGSELFVLIFCGSLVTTRPLWEQMCGVTLERSRTSEMGITNITRCFCGGPKLTKHSDSSAANNEMLLHPAAQPVHMIKAGTSDNDVQNGAIRATTDIEITRSRRWNNV